MMYRILTLLSIFLSISIFASCLDVEPILISEEEIKTDFLEKFKEIRFGESGQLHNDILEFSLQKAIQEGGLVPLESKKFTQRIYQQYSGPGKVQNPADFETTHNFVFELSTEDKAVVLADSDMDDRLANFYLDLCHFTDQNEHVDLYFERIIDFENELTRAPTANDELSWIILDIAKGSLYYWAHNLNRWHSELTLSKTYSAPANIKQPVGLPLNGLKTNWDAAGVTWLGNTLGTMVVSDIGGGMHGAVRGIVFTGGNWQNNVPGAGAYASSAAGFLTLYFNRCPNGGNNGTGSGEDGDNPTGDPGWIDPTLEDDPED